MFVRNFDECKKFVAGDGSMLREFLHANEGDLKIRYSLAHAIVKPGQSTKVHKLKTSEVYYILKGKGRIFIDEESRDVGQDMAIYIPPGAKQHIKNTGKGNLEFLCIVDPAWKEEDEEIFE